ncbi:MAG: Mu transposase C-terminal domain-containing protein [Sterolibacterium sp.]|nr:Mu transposase C-terminal domain-containing protein [Sterolibacterium sp.]
MMMLAAIIRFNRTPRDGYIWPAKYGLSGLQPIPRDIWNLEIRERAGTLSRISEERVRFSLLPRDKATVTREGIRLDHCFYSCAEAMERGWMVAAGRGSFKVTVSYDRRLVDTIYIHDDRNPTLFFVASLLDRCSDYRGLSFQEVEAIEYQREMLRQEGRSLDYQQKFEFHKIIDPIAKQARTQTKEQSKGLSRKGRKKDIADDRLEERRLQRQREARIPGPVPKSAQSAEVIPLIPNKASVPQPEDESVAATPPAAAKDDRRRQKYLEILNGK